MTNQEDFDERAAIARAQSGDAAAFAELTERNRLRLYHHCYRMLGSGHEAEEAVQDSLVRAWQRLDSFEGRGSFAGWVYRISTNLCIDRLRGRRPRQHPVGLGPPAMPGAMPGGPESGLEWIEPVGDHLLGLGQDPAHSATRRERVNLAFVVALQQLSARQRAALLLHDVLDFSQDEVAEVLDTSQSAVNSLLYRARQSVGTTATTAQTSPDDPEVRKLLDRYVRAWEVADISELLATVSDDVRFAMPPLRTWYQGAQSVAGFVEAAIFGPARPHGITLRLGRANGQPALGVYRPGPEGSLIIDGLQVLEVDGSGKSQTCAITAITSFRNADLAVECGFPARLSSTLD